MVKEDIYYYCTKCGHVHLRNSELGKLHLAKSFKTQKQKKEMELVEKGMGPVDWNLEKGIAKKRFKKIMKKL